MTDFKEWRDRRFHEETLYALNMIDQLQEAGDPDLLDIAAYNVLRDYINRLLVVLAEFLSAEQIAEVQEVVEQLNKLTGQTREPGEMPDDLSSDEEDLADAKREPGSETPINPEIEKIIRDNLAASRWWDEDDDRMMAIAKITARYIESHSDLDRSTACSIALILTKQLMEEEDEVQE